MADEEPPEESGESVASPSAGAAASAIGRVWSNPAYRFVLFFIPYLGIASFLYPRFAERYHAQLQQMIIGTASILDRIFGLFSDKMTSSSKLLMFDGFAVTIVDECTGIYEVIIFTAAVLAFPTTLRNKVLGIVLGNGVIYVFNILRICVLILIGRYYPLVFEFMHVYFWQATMIIMIASVWLLWIAKVVNRDFQARSDIS